MSVWKQLFLLCLLGALAYGGYEGYQRYLSPSDTSLPAANAQKSGSSTIVEVTAASVATLRHTVEAVGTTRARQSVEIVPEAEGRIVELAITPGAKVERGAVLVRLDDAIARADLAEAEARLKERSQALDRIRQLRRTNAAAEATLEEAEARRAEALAQLDRAARRLEERTITAPFAGIVGLSNVDTGARVDQSTLITKLDDLDEIEIEFALPETLFAQVSMGQAVTATSAAFPGEQFQGQIEAKDSRIDPVSRSFRTRAILPNPEGTLPAGMFMSLELILSEAERVVVPEEALVFQAAETYVFVVKDGTARRVPLETGQRRDGMVAVLAGLEVGDLVVIRGLQTLRDGSPVEILGEDAGNESTAQAESADDNT
ncbi:efflux RND transporter periplasmic adaptor subunit [Roseovarius pacificus]|uniref:efflux RND transporter periplasmic adaptor subunit n=1 Tax=Roseovarius pacificus TaxID=337701 RepID=UPI004039B91D